MPAGRPGRRVHGPGVWASSSRIDARAMPEERSYDAGDLWWTMVTVPGPCPRRRAVPGAAAGPAAGLGAAGRDLHGDLRAGRASPRPPARLDPRSDARELDLRDQRRLFLGWRRSPSSSARWPEMRASSSSRTPERLGFLRNFERAIALAPAAAELIALADQDDRWDRDKLDVLARRPRGRAAGAARLQRRSDRRLRRQRPLRDLLLRTPQQRREHGLDDGHQQRDRGGLAVPAGAARGGAAVPARRHGPGALPRPLAGALRARSGPARLPRAPDPRLHPPRRLGDAHRGGRALGIAAPGPPRRRADARPPARPPASPRLAQPRLALRLHGPLPADPPARHDPAPPARSRADRPAAPPRHRSIAAAEHSPRAALWLLGRSFRPWIGRNDTLARERVIFGGIVWRKLVGRR